MTMVQRKQVGILSVAAVLVISTAAGVEGGTVANPNPMGRVLVQSPIFSADPTHGSAEIEMEMLGRSLDRGEMPVLEHRDNISFNRLRREISRYPDHSLSERFFEMSTEAFATSA